MRRSPRPRAGAATRGATPLVALVAALALVLTGLLAALLAGLLAASPSAAAPSPTASEIPSETPSENPSEGADGEVEPDAPLHVVLRQVQPAVLPEDPDREVTVTGTVRNLSDAVWSDLNGYLLSSDRPLTNAAELAAAVGSDPAAEVGERIVEPGLFEDLPDLAPGESASFRLSVPRSAFDVSGEPGVYWLGVHVLGTSDDGGRDLAADGRARTFLPLVPKGTGGTEVAVVAQLRARVARLPDGRLTYPDLLARSIARGRLDRLLGLGRTAGRWPVTWTVDPAVLEAVGSIVDGNPTYDAADAGTDAGDATGDATGDGAADGAGDAAGEGAADAAAPQGRAARRAARWLAAFTAQAQRHQVMALPYGDVDVAAAYSNARAALSTYALDVSDRFLETLGVDAQPIVAPPTGYLPANALTALAPEVVSVLGPAAVPALARPLIETSTGTTTLVAGTPETTRGPRPGAPRSALAVRQRLLAETALHALSADRGQPVVALLPARWDPGPAWRDARFFAGLSQRWLRLVDLDEARRDARPAQLPLPDGLIYPDDEASVEVPGFVLSATADLITEGATYESVFIDGATAGDVLGRQALLSSSVWNRPRPGLAAARARGATALVRTLLNRVAVRSPTFVTLSSEDGDFIVTLANGLQERIRVGLDATVSGPGLELTTPGAVTLEPNERRSVRIAVRSSGLGIHRVFLQPTTDTGLPVGDPATLNVRSSSVGLVLWVIMAGGSLVLFGAIAVRIVRRIRRRRATHGPLLAEHAARQTEGAA